MKITCLVLVFIGLAALACAESGYFVPKAFYKLDAEGHKSNVHEINPHQANILRRLRRQTSSSSSSSSSTFTANGGPTFFEQHNSVKTDVGGFGLQSRFGGDDESIGYGHAVHTQGVISNGRVVYQETKHQKL